MSLFITQKLRKLISCLLQKLDPPKTTNTILHAPIPDWAQNTQDCIHMMYITDYLEGPEARYYYFLTSPFNKWLDIY